MFEKFNIGQGNPAQWKPQRPDKPNYQRFEPWENNMSALRQGTTKIVGLLFQ